MIDQLAFGVQSMLAVLVLLFVTGLVFKRGFLRLVRQILHAVFTDITKTTVITVGDDHRKGHPR
jgi:hypothetical protein